ncbi:MAG: hypothetical protein KA264_02105 [Crocinitomicaceae bacterium]|nr:hypothetical protein [Crocinitomicaceae bacterium]
MIATLIYLSIVISFVWMIKKNKLFNYSQTYKKWISIAFILKIFATLGMWYIYTYYFTDHSVNDIYKYYKDGEILHSLIKENTSDFIKLIRGKVITNPNSILKINELKYWVKINNYGIYNDNQTIILINSIFLFLSNGNMIIQSLYFSTVAFFVTLLLFNSFSIYFKEKQKYLFGILFFTPSILLWTSGIFKETIIWISLSLLIININTLLTSLKKWPHILFLPFCIFLLLISKAYFMAFILPTIGCILIYLIFNSINIKHIFRSVYLLLFAFFIFFALFHNPITYNYEGKNRKEQIEEFKRVTTKSYERNVLGNDFNILEMVRFKQVDYKYEARVKKANSVIKIKEIDGNLINLFECLPLGFINAITRPSLLDINSPFIALPAIENTLLFILILIVIKFNSQLTNKQKAIELVLRYFTVSLLIFLGILVPVLGNLVRYRAPVLPYILIILLFHLNLNQLTDYFEKFKTKKQS